MTGNKKGEAGLLPLLQPGASNPPNYFGDFFFSIMS